MSDPKLEDLFYRFTSGKTSDAENREMMRLMADEANEKLVGDLFQKAWDDFKPESNPFAADKSQQLLEGIREKIGRLKRSGRIIYMRVAAAAAILVVFSFGIYLLAGRTGPKQRVAQVQQDIAPGGNKAVLTLGNGRQILLTDAKKGVLANENNTNIMKTADGQITYQGAAAGKKALVYNTVSTPRGGRYALVLADGTKVFLNAASSLKYPAAFTGSNRQVELTGEAYFEVVHNSRKPFMVLTKGQIIEDLGTHFNINAYAEEPVEKATLLEGRIRVVKGEKAAILKPGQEAISGNQQDLSAILVQDADTDQAVAWKNGYFMFNGENIKTIMRSISRWYDVDVVYRTNVTGKDFSGGISCFDNISKVLAMLESTHTVHFKIEGRRIIVMD
jgi:transmembrane sensor